jgi:hypothetical protein
LINKETLKIVSEKSKENAQLKNELCQVRKLGEEQAGAAKALEDKLEGARGELRRGQEEWQQAQQRLRACEQEGHELRLQLQQVADKCKLLAAEGACKDEQLLQTRCQLQATLEKLNFKAWLFNNRLFRIEIPSIIDIQSLESKFR